MQQLTFLTAGHLEWREVPAPTLQQPGQAIVRPIAVATCDLDAALIRGQAPFTGPFALGHEFIAEVIEVGEAVQRVAPGQLVIVPFQISCGTCARCQRGQTGDCLEVQALSMYGLAPVAREWGGALSDLVLIPFAEAMLVPLPDDITPASIASASDNLPDAWRTVGPYLEDQPGASVLIVGGGASGSVGLYAVAIARALEASQVDYCDRDPRRLAVAQRLGARPIEVSGTPPSRLGTYPITVDASSDAAGLSCALRSTEPGGVCTSTGIYYGEVPLPLLEMYTTGVTLKTGRIHARATIPNVLDLVRAGRLHPEQVTSETASWEEAIDALLSYQTKLIITRDRQA